MENNRKFEINKHTLPKFGFINSGGTIINKCIIIDIETPYSFNIEDGIREVACIVVDNYNVVDTLHLAIITDENKYKDGYGSGLESIEDNEDFKNKFKEFISKYK